MEVDIGHPRAYFLMPDGSVICRPIKYVVSPGAAQRVKNENIVLNAYLTRENTDGGSPSEAALLRQNALERTINRAELLLYLDSGAKIPRIFDRIRQALSY